MTEHILVEQGSPEWLAARLGKVTASRFSDVLAKGSGKTRKAYMYELAAERLTGLPTQSYKSADMEWGSQCEEAARKEYELWTSNKADRVGLFVLNNNIGASPDSVVGEDGLLEIKCPKTTTQIDRFLNKEFPSEYMAQVQGQLWVTGRSWCDFVSYDPRINTEARYFCIRVLRDEVYIKNLEVEVSKFVADLELLMKSLGAK